MSVQVGEKSLEIGNEGMGSETREGSRAKI
jgi:hypothetical protein